MKTEKTSPESVASVAGSLSTLSTHGLPVRVSLSNDLIHLLSHQLYNSPVKAVEELVVNSYDANARNCYLFVPPASDFDQDYVVVFDDGTGMSHEGLNDLWQIGHSPKSREEKLEKLTKRKQIGKFGIGKLAARTIADKLTYITKQNSTILAVSVDFNEFRDSEEAPSNRATTETTNSGATDIAETSDTDITKIGVPEAAERSAESNMIKNISKEVYEIQDLDEFIASTSFGEMLSKAIPDEAIESVNTGKATNETIKFSALLSKLDSWTIAILENLTIKSRSIKQNTLKWVLSTAMPLASEFKLFLNGVEIQSDKEDYEKIIEFKVIDLPQNRLDNLKDSTSIEWQKKGESLIAKQFPEGISGDVFITLEPIAGKKSDDLMRSHGFFIRVRDRLIDYKDPLFGLKALFFGTFNRFHASIKADDLDTQLKASRDAFEETDTLNAFRELLKEVFNEANTRYEKWSKEKPSSTSNKEGERNQVQPQLVEYPVADVLVSYSNSLQGSEADDSWFYLKFPDNTDVKQLLKELYEPNRTKKYKYEYGDSSETARMVKFDPGSATFHINKKHQFVQEYFDVNQRLLENVVTAEALLEVYLRQNDVPLHSIFEILEQRDKLLRSLANDSSYSFATIAGRLRDSASHENELEISLVVAARALGFNAKHISGSGTPDGVASFENYALGRKRITLEAKSSINTPGLPQLDFGGLDEHVKDEKGFEEIYFSEIEQFGDEYKGEGKFDGCLLVAPKYPGQTLGTNAVANRARNLKVSCWTVEQLAQVVESAERKKINAEKVLNIVLNKFAPRDVSEAIKNLLSDPGWDYPDLYQAIFEVIERQMQFFANLQAVTVDGIIFGISSSSNESFRKLTKEHIVTALQDMVGVSQEGMKLDSQNIIILVSLEELRRRLESLIKGAVKPRRLSSFRQHE
jgi:hypothetical protein